MNLRQIYVASYSRQQDDYTGAEIAMVRVTLACGHRVRWKDNGSKYVAIHCEECEIDPDNDWLDWLKQGIKSSRLYQEKVLGHLNNLKEL